MHCVRLLVILSAIAAVAFASTGDVELPEVQVIVYKGPTECANSNKKGKDGQPEEPNLVEADYIVGLHFTVTVDPSSVGSRESLGRKIESSHDKGFAPSFPGDGVSFR